MTKLSKEEATTLVERGQELLSTSDRFKEWILSLKEGTTFTVGSPHICPIAQFLHCQDIPSVGIGEFNVFSDYLDEAEIPSIWVVAKEHPEWSRQLILYVDKLPEQEKRDSQTVTREEILHYLSKREEFLCLEETTA